MKKAVNALNSEFPKRISSARKRGPQRSGQGPRLWSQTHLRLKARASTGWKIMSGDLTCPGFTFLL